MIKILSKVGTEGTYLNITKVIYDKPTTEITVKIWKPSIRIQGQNNNAHFCCFCIIVLEVLATVISQGKEIKGIPIGREEI